MIALKFKRYREKLFPAPTIKESRALAADALGVSPATVSFWEYGVRRIPVWAVKLLKCLEKQK
jgi:DNA-binding transcriptional regulator YiaG